MKFFLFTIVSGKRSFSYSVAATSETEARLRLQISLQGFDHNEEFPISSIRLERVYDDFPAHIQP